MFLGLRDVVRTGFSEGARIQTRLLDGRQHKTSGTVLKAVPPLHAQDDVPCVCFDEGGQTAGNGGRDSVWVRRSRDEGSSGPWLLVAPGSH